MILGKYDWVETLDHPNASVSSEHSCTQNCNYYYYYYTKLQYVNQAQCTQNTLSIIARNIYHIILHALSICNSNAAALAVPFISCVAATLGNSGVLQVTDRHL